MIVGAAGIGRPCAFCARRSVVVGIQCDRSAVELLDRPGELVPSPALRTLIALFAIDVFGEVRSIAGRRAFPTTCADRTIVMFDSRAVAAFVSLPNAGSIRVDVNRARALRINDLDIAVFKFDPIGVQTKRCCGSRASATAAAAAPARRVTIRAIIWVDVWIDISSKRRPAGSKRFAIPNRFAVSNRFAISHRITP